MKLSEEIVELATSFPGIGGWIPVNYETKILAAADRAAELEKELAETKAELAELKSDPDRCSICGGYDPNGTHYACDMEAIAKRKRETVKNI